jgi:hypothetical protein
VFGKAGAEGKMGSDTCWGAGRPLFLAVVASYDWVCFAAWAGADFTPNWIFADVAWS